MTTGGSSHATRSPRGQPRLGSPAALSSLNLGNVLLYYLGNKGPERLINLPKDTQQS